MHRIRTWARTKAHGPSPLIAEARRTPSRSQNGAVPPATATAGAAAAAAASEPAPDEPAQVAPRLGRKAARKNMNVGMRFFLTVKDILFSSIFNILLVFVPVGIAVNFSGASAGIVFAMNAIAIIPLAGLLSHATESVASRLGDTIGALMNVTFGNAVELIIFIIALVKDEIRIVQASLLGSILANLLLILGMCFLLGGLRFREQIYNSTVTQMSACLLSLSVTSLLLPTAFHASFRNYDMADDRVLQVSRGTSVVLLLVYGMYLLFQLNSHAYMYESTPQHIIEREAIPGPAAHYFNSSSSSETSSSSSDTDDSTTTAKKIKRMIRRGKRSRKQSVNSEQAGSSHSPPDAGLETERPGSSERTETLPSGGASTVVVADDAMDEADEMAVQPKDQRKKHKHKHRHHRRRPRNSEDGDDLSHTQSAPTHGDGDGDQHRVTFAVASDLEAQEATTQTKPFSLRALRPPIPRSMMQNVFTSPPQNPALAISPEVQQRGNLRRTASLPPESHQQLHYNPREPNHQLYRLPPGAIPPIVPIVVNTVPKKVKSGDDDDDDDDEPEISHTTAVILLLTSTGLVALCAEFMVDSIRDVVGDGSVISEAFIGLILLPIVGNAAEHVTAVTVAMKNKMDLAIGVALGSSIQIAIFVTPLVVIIGWIMNKEMSLYFTLFETVSMFVSAFIVNFLVLDGRSNYLEGALLCSAYVIIAVAAFFYPNAEAANSLGGGDGDGDEAVATGARMLVRGLGSMMGL